ncbi:YuiB family protein [Lederbergia sp. NSJ-179]|uniref:YuiB family protein n=1 Tax=Lederbergia sp. NSJ-179 TaxID=2931402 RepID=UPI001FD159D1|nr:YuiB family protein [Lederbergia sp. NSJ-179]MCJ7843463.1 YuiB family protein [Lederbergia sp. NSJ-179]
MSLPVLIISMLLFFVLFFGIGFILNMLLRMTWIMAIVYPVVALLIINTLPISQYFTNSKTAFSQLGENLSKLAPADITILSAGFVGALLSGVTMRTLRAKGYRMF